MKCKKEYMKHQLVYIEWEDAMASSKWRTELEALEWGEHGSYIVKECGWILKETKTYILISAVQSPPDYEDKEARWSSVERIPKTWIRKRKNIKI